VCILHANGSNDKVNYVRDNWLKQLEVGWTEYFTFKVGEGINIFVRKLGPAVDSTKPPVLWVGLLLFVWQVSGA